MSGLDSRKTPHSRVRTFGLRVLVHGEAFLGDPIAYLSAVWARITGKKLRSQLRLAPLLGKARHAYDLWLARRPDCTHALAANIAGDIRIVALIGSSELDDEVRRSLDREGVEFQIAHDATRIDNFDPGCELWLLLLTGGDLLAEGAGAKYRLAASQADAMTHVIYADDDLIDQSGKRHSPHFKPDWNAELFRHHDYCTGSALVRASSVGLENIPQTGDWAQELLQQAIAVTENGGGTIVHLREILHHRKARPLPQIPSARLRFEADTRDYPSVSVIVPTRNRLELIRTCMEGLARTDYAAPIEVIIVDNGSDDPATQAYLSDLSPEFARVLRDDGPFNFAALNNRAVRETSGDLLCFCNNDLEFTDPQWLHKLAVQAMRPEVGAVGPQLLYPDGRIQHAGVVTGIGGAAAHAHRFLYPEQGGYFSRHNLPQFVSAVTAACMALSRAKFEAAGGFDADNFAVSFNDVDLCLRLAEKGWKSLYEPRVQLVHHESVSRGFDRDTAGAARQSREVKALQERWGTTLDRASGQERMSPCDPYHHPELSPLSEQFVIGI